MNLFVAPEKTIPCEMCSKPTPMLGTKLCNGCWEITRHGIDNLKKGIAFLEKKEKEQKGMDAVDRGMELLHTPMKDLPPLALLYAKDLCSRLGGCIEVFLTAYSTYAQLEEGLTTDDDLYIPPPSEVAIFKKLKEANNG